MSSVDSYITQRINGSQVADEVRLNDFVLLDGTRPFSGRVTAPAATLTAPNVTQGFDRIGTLDLSSANPGIRWRETDRADGLAGKHYWLYHNAGLLYLLQDRLGDGTWQTPYPLLVMSTGEVRFGFVPTVGGTAALAQVASGAYTGNGAVGRTISLPFPPVAVQVSQLSAVHVSGTPDQANGFRVAGTAVTTSGLQENRPGLAANGFTVGVADTGALTTHTNFSGRAYGYVAFG